MGDPEVNNRREGGEKEKKKKNAALNEKDEKDGRT